MNNWTQDAIDNYSNAYDNILKISIQEIVASLIYKVFHDMSIKNISIATAWRSKIAVKRNLSLIEKLVPLWLKHIYISVLIRQNLPKEMDN